MEAKAWLCLVLLPGIFASPFSWDETMSDDSVRFQTQCSPLCTGSSKFQYQVGKTYHYRYEVSSITNIHHASESKARVEASADAFFHVLSKCELALTLSDVSLKRSEPDSDMVKDVTTYEYKMALENYVLRFSFQDGQVEEICPSENEEPYSLNFKRAILSAFQNSMSQHDRPETLNEIDVTGNCPTVYSVSQRGTRSMQISKTKDLLGCSDRHYYRTSLQSMPFHAPNTIKSLPLLKGNHKCTQTISKTDGHVTLSLCLESLVFRPFSRKEAGARTETTQRLQHVKTVPQQNIQKDGVFKKSSLVYEHAKNNKELNQILWSAKEKLNQLCQASVDDVSAEVPALFAELVYLMRGMESKDIMDVWERVDRGSICSYNHDRALKFILDSLPMVGTSASIEVMTEMLLASRVTGTEAEMWMTSFTFIQHPEKSMIKQLKRLLLSETHRKYSLLPVTSLVDNFCRSQIDCMSSTEVVDVIDILNNILGSDCKDADQDLMLIALRAIGNIGHADQVAPVLEKCMTLSSNKMNTRVMAAQAFRGVTCKSKQNSLMDLLMNKGEDSELRITAYMSLMLCPTEALFQKVKLMLETEEVNQVGSYIWTHLTNLMESASPHKQGLREILEDENLKKEFDMDKRKYSRNYEWSYFSEKFGTGAMAESNLIWSSSSFLPRSLMLNLTIDFLGQSVNLLEVGARAQGLEKVIMNYFGPGGVFENKDKTDNFNNPSRCVKKSKMNNMKEKHGVEEDEMSASFYLRMFGSDLDFKHFNEKDIMDIKKKLSTTEILSSLAKGDTISFSHSAMFLDSTVSVPTIGGMALELSINGTSSIELKATGKMNLRRLSLKKMEMNFNVRPSGAIQLAGVMALNSGITKTGLRMVTTLHSSTAVAGNIDLTNGQILSAFLDTPKEKLEVLDVKSEFFVLHDEAEEKQTMIQDKTVTVKDCSSKSLLKAVGYEACTELSYIDTSNGKMAPYFPLTGPASFSLVVNKRDAPRGFKVLGKYIKTDNSYTGHASFSTPGSQVDRHLVAGYFIDTKARSMEMELTSPWKKLLLKGHYVVNDNTRSMLATFVNDGREYTLEIKTEKQRETSKTIWIPTIRVVRPADSALVKFAPKMPEQFAVDGRVEIANRLTEISAEMTISSGVKPDPIEVKASYVNKKAQKSVAGSVTLNKKKTYAFTLQAQTTFTGKRMFPSKIQPTILISVPDSRLFLLDGSIDYKESKMLKADLTVNMEKALKKPIKFNFKITSNKKKAQVYRVNGKLISEFAVVKTRGAVNVPIPTGGKKNSALVSAKITTNYILPTIKNKALKKNTVVMNFKVNDRSTKAIKKYYASINLDSKKYKDASFMAIFDVAHKASFTKSKMIFKRDPNVKDKSQELNVETTISHKISNRGADINYDVHAVYPIKKIEYHWKGKHEHTLAKVFSFETYNMVVLSKGKTIELRLKGDDKSKKLLEAFGNVELSYPSFTIGKKSFNAQNYKLTTIIQQTPEKDYVHTVNLRTTEGVKHIMTTTFRKSKNNNFVLNSQVDINGQHRSKITMTAMKDDTKVDTSVLFEKDNKMYRGQVGVEKVQKKYWNANIDVIYPERRITSMVEGGMKNSKSMFSGHCSWDADKDLSKKVQLEMSSSAYMAEQNGENYEMEYSYKLETPFEGHTIYQLDRRVKIMPTKGIDEFTYIFGTPENELSYKYLLILPATIERFETMLEIKTPFEKFRKGRTEIQHKFDGSKHLSSVISGAYNEHEASATVKFINQGDLVTNRLESSLGITSTFSDYKSLTLTFNHNDDGKAYTSNLIFEKNGENYEMDLTADYFRVDYMLKLFSTLNVNLPDGRTVTVILNHDNTLTNMDSSITGRWPGNNQMKLVLNAKFNKAEKDYILDVSFTSTLDKINSMIIKSHYNDMNGQKGSFFSEVNNNPSTTYNYKYTYTDKEFSYEGSSALATYSGEIKYERYPYTLLIKHSQKGENGGNFVLDASVDKSHNGWTGDLQLLTPFAEARNIGVRGHLKEKNNVWTLDTQISLDVKKNIELDFSVDVEKWTQMTCQIKSPYEEMSFMKFGFLNDEKKNMYNTTVFIEIQPVFNMVKMNTFVSLKPNFSTQVSLDMPDFDFKYIKLTATAVEQRRGVKTNVNVKYHPEKEIDLNLRSRWSKNRFPEKNKLHFDFSSPYEVLRSLNLKTDIDNKNGKWIANWNLKSSNKKLEYFDVHYELLNSETAFHSDLEVKYPTFEPIVSGIHLDWGDNIGTNLTLVAPEIGRTVFGFKLKSKSWLDFQEKIFGEIQGHELDIDLGLKHDELTTKAWLTYMFPGADQSFIKTHLYREGNAYDDFDVGTFLQVGKHSPEYNISVQYGFTDVKSSIGLTFITPHTMPFSYLGKAVLQGPERKSSGYLMLGKDYLIDSTARTKVTESLWEYEYNVKYLFDGKGHDIANFITANWNSEGEELKITHDYDDKHIELVGAHKNAKANGNNKETLDILLFTPYEHVKDVGLHAFINMNEKNYDGECVFEYMDDKEAELFFNLRQKTANHLDLDATLTLPETDYKTNTLKYSQVNRRDKFTADATLALGTGEQARGKVEFKNTEEFIITITGPIEEFETLSITGKYNEEQQRLNGDVQLKLKLHPKPANLEFDIFVNNMPVQLYFKLQTPYDNFKKAELTITHTGDDWKKFNTLSTLTSEAIGRMNSDITFDYNTQTDMDVKATLTSSLENVKNLKFGFNTKEQKDEQVSHLEVGWDVNKEIIVDSSWAFDSKKVKKAFKTNFEIATPFDEMKSVIFKFSHQNGENNMNQYINIAHNGRTHLDSTVSYKIGQKHIGSIDIRYPRPMAFDLEAEVGDQTLDGNLKVNWDKHSPESLFEFVTKISDNSGVNNLDKSFSFKVIHPVRLMGLDFQIKSADKEILSTGRLTWDERKGKTFSYDIGYSDRSTKYSQMYDGHVKFGVPQRSVKVEGLHRDTGSSKTLSTSLFWDADKDETKKVVLSSTTEQQDRLERMSLNLNLPYINKQMNMGITRKKEYGSYVLETDAEISYSSDSRKNILIKTKMDNTEMDPNDLGNFNYTVDLGFIHPITGIDIRWESHLSQVNQLSTTGSRLTYATANEGKKVLAFWTQLDSDQSKGEMMIVTPLKTVTVTGDVDNDNHRQAVKCHVLEDGIEAVKLDVKIDPRRRNMEAEIHYDRENANKMFSMTGNYLGDSALQINFVSQDGYQRVSESQIAVTLNTSEILHTRIQWRPSLFKEIQTFLSTEAAVLSHTANEAFSQTLNDVGDEVKTKYARVSQELRDEMKPVFDLMEKEMDGLSTQLESLRTAYRRFYQNNNLGIRSMGEKINEAFSGLLNTVQMLVKEYRAYYTGITKAQNKWLNDLRTYPIMKEYLAASTELIERLKRSRIVIEETLEKLSEELMKISEVTYKLYSNIKRNIDRKLSSYNRIAHDLPMYQQMMAQRNLIPGTPKVAGWLQSYERIYVSFQHMLQDQFEDIMARKEFREMYAIGAEVHQQFMYYNLEQNLESAIERVFSLSKNLILMELMKMKDAIMSMEKSRLIVYDPERGELQFELHLPVHMKSLTEPPKFKLQAFSKLKSWVMSKAPAANHSLWDSYYEYVPPLNPSKWVPPFEASGYVIGSQHILTFDKTHYDFASSCSHVLARDMLHDNFSVVLNYNRNQQMRQIKSLCLHFEDSLSMEISSDYQLTVNNKETEMPFYSEIVSVIREGDLITVKYVGGLMVVCNPHLDLYKVTLSGWYHGRTAGLLGVYDNEKMNDKRLPEMVRDFEVNRRTCRISDNVAVSPSPDNDKDNMCIQMFEDNSSKFRPCFKQVDPAEFLKMCQIYMADMSSDDAIHKVTEQYRFVCRDQGVFMGPLDEYVPCNREKPIIVDGTDPLYKSADVLFVVQDSKCNQWMSSSLGSVVTEINKVLNTADMKNSRFGLLGVEKMNPTVRTMNGNFFGPASHFLKAIETLQFSEEESSFQLSSALPMAMKYPFRPGVAKVLMLAPCSDCKVGLLDRNIDTVLKNNGFHIHILKQDQATNDQTSNEIPGTYYFDAPNDYCEVLAKTTKGSVLDITPLTQSKVRSQKKNVQDIAEKVGWSTKLPKCQRCQCNSETGQTECQLCEANPIFSYLPLRGPSLSDVIVTMNDINTLFGHT